MFTSGMMEKVESMARKRLVKMWHGILSKYAQKFHGRSSKDLVSLSSWDFYEISDRIPKCFCTGEQFTGILQTSWAPKIWGKGLLTGEKIRIYIGKRSTLSSVRGSPGWPRRRKAISNLEYSCWFWGLPSTTADLGGCSLRHDEKEFFGKLSIFIQTAV